MRKVATKPKGWVWDDQHPEKPEPKPDKPKRRREKKPASRTRSSRSVETRKGNPFDVLLCVIGVLFVCVEWILVLACSAITVLLKTILSVLLLFGAIGFIAGGWRA